MFSFVFFLLNSSSPPKVVKKCMRRFAMRSVCHQVIVGWEGGGERLERVMAYEVSSKKLSSILPPSSSYLTTNPTLSFLSPHLTISPRLHAPVSLLPSHFSLPSICQQSDGEQQHDQHEDGEDVCYCWLRSVLEEQYIPTQIIP